MLYNSKGFGSDTGFTAQFWELSAGQTGGGGYRLPDSPEKCLPADLRRD